MPGYQGCFQGENSLELRTHLRRSGHIASDFQEECYTCKNKFKSYWHLMNHRKREHPSNKRCRYFLQNECVFDEMDCWYKHVNVHEYDEMSFKFECNECENEFLHKSELMKHKKDKHRNKVSICKDFLKGKCFNDVNDC